MPDQPRALERLLFVSRNAAENTAGWHDWAVISITEPYGAFGEARLQHGWYAIHRSQFHDVEPDPKRIDALQEPMVSRQAVEVVDFVHAVSPHVQGILVHCQAGISRSAAVAKWIAGEYRLPFNNHYSQYNRHVYQLLVEAGKTRSKHEHAANG